MGEVVGWDDGRPLRRPRRWPWVLAAVAVAAAVAAPWVERAWERREDRWLEGRWALASAYDTARGDVLTAVVNRMVPGDEPALTEAVTGVDREEAAALRRIAGQVRDRLLVGPAERRAAGAIRASLLAQAAYLAHEAATWRAAGASTPGWYDLATDRVIDRADAAVRGLLQGRPLPTATARLHAADATMAALGRPIDRRTGLRLLVAEPGSAYVVDLDSGRRHPLDGRLLTDAAGSIGPSVVVTPRCALVSVNGTLAVIPLDGSPAHLLPDVDAAAPADGGRVWAIGQRAVRLLDAAGATVAGPWRIPGSSPAGVAEPGSYVVGAAGPLLVVGRGGARQQATYTAWDPRTARTVPIPGGECSNVVGVGTGLLISASCTDLDHLRLTDPATGRTRLLPVPGPLDGVLLSSPDGRRLVVQTTGPRGGPSSWVVDVATGRTTPVPSLGDLLPVQWSVDGRYLLLVDARPDPGGPPLHLWWPGAAQPVALRIRPEGSAAAALVP